MEEGRQGRFNFLFEYFLGCARLDRVVGIPHEVDFITFAHRLPDGGLHPVQSQVGQNGRDDAALRCAFGGRKQLTLVHVTGFEPLVEYAFVHRDIL